MCGNIILVGIGLLFVAQGLKYVRVLDLSDRIVPYKDAWDWQASLMDQQISLQTSKSKGMEDVDVVGHILLLQHRSVYTLGTASEEGSGPFSKMAPDGTLLEYDLFETERAGQATYHGPGQVVMYPILDLNHFERDIHVYLRGLEEMTIQTLATYGIDGSRKEGLTGVWVGAAKVAAIGIKLRRWVTMHGVALNVCPDMRYFSNIVPCGISDTSMSVGAIVNWVPSVDVAEVAPRFMRCFAEHFGVQQLVLSGDEAEAYIQRLASSRQ